MKINTFSNLRLVKLVYFLLIVILCGALVLLLEYLTFNVPELYTYLFLIFSVTGLFIIRLSGYNSFFIDTTGEVLTFETLRCNYFGIGNNTAKKVDFPKGKLKDYKIKRGLLSTTITLIVTSKKNETGKVKIPFKLSFLSSSNRKLIENEFIEIIKKNELLKPTQNVDINNISTNEYA